VLEQTTAQGTQGIQGLSGATGASGSSIPSGLDMQYNIMIMVYLALMLILFGTK
jgi:hypothetical protein